MSHFDEAVNRMFRNIYVCKVCKARRRAQPLKVLAGKVACRKCGSKALRTVRKK